MTKNIQIFAVDSGPHEDGVLRHRARLTCGQLGDQSTPSQVTRRYHNTAFEIDKDTARAYENFRCTCSDQLSSRSRE
jgi:hypothetical protein